MSRVNADSLKEFLKAELQAQPVISRLEKIIQERTSKAGTRHEEVFTREFLCPAIRKFFYVSVRPELNLSDDEIKRGLGTEGYENCPGFGFTPARGEKHLFTKSDIIEASPPESWLTRSAVPLPAFQACPDFAISKPLPFSIVGEVKYFAAGSPESAVRELYNASRQAVFYLGAFHGAYDSAMIVVADASKDHAFFEGMQSIRSEVLARFGSETRIHLLCVKLL
jgi:hypothetical protein